MLLSPIEENRTKARRLGNRSKGGVVILLRVVRKV